MINCSLYATLNEIRMSWSLFFTDDASANIPPGGIRILPTNSGWNDFHIILIR